MNAQDLVDGPGPMPLWLYLIRHGGTAWSISGQHTGRTDVPVDTRGRESGETPLQVSDRPIDSSRVSVPWTARSRSCTHHRVVEHDRGGDGQLARRDAGARCGRDSAKGH
jgi:hypothetical protein